MSLVDDLPGVAKVDAEIAENARLEAAYISAHAEQVSRYDAAIAQHEAAVSDALNTGKVPPADRPPEPATDSEHADRLVMFQNRRSMLQEQRLLVIAREKPKVDLQTSAAYHDLIDQAGRSVAVLKRIARDIAVLQNSRFEALCAQIACDPSRGSGASRPPAPPKVDAEAVVAAVQRGVDLLSVETERRLGLQSSNLHEIRQPPAGLEPKPGPQPIQKTHSTLGMRQPYCPGR